MKNQMRPVFELSVRRVDANLDLWLLVDSLHSDVGNGRRGFITDLGLPLSRPIGYGRIFSRVESLELHGDERSGRCVLGWRRLRDYDHRRSGSLVNPRTVEINGR